MTPNKLEAPSDPPRSVARFATLVLACAPLATNAAVQSTPARAGAPGAKGDVSAPSSLREKTETWVRTNQKRIVDEFLDLLAIPNVAADRANIELNATFLKAMIEKRGFRAEVLETEGNPLVWGERLVKGATTTVLVYCQFDGQPVNAKGWAQADPFVPILRSGRIDEGGREISPARGQRRYENDWRIFARAASDAKGPIIAFMAALDALAAQGLEPTVNLRVIMDGEEEISSPNLVPAIERYREKLKADFMLVFDGPMHFTDEPTLVFGARGIQTAQLTVFGPKSGVHSGNYGNWVPNPALRLAHLLASMKDDRGNILVDGFFDDLVPLSAEERTMIDAVPSEDARLLRVFGIAKPERDDLSLQMGFQRPTLNIRGMQSAFIGGEARTIIPDRAVAELDIRLVKETNGQKMLDRLRAHIVKQGYHVVDEDPSDATRARFAHIAKLVSPRRAATAAFRTSPLLPESRRVSEALERVWGAPPVRIRTGGGTVPISQFIEALGFPAMLVPIVNFDNNQHEENENLRLSNLFRGIVTYAGVLRM
jgi:acetylornithine deacetylase/succinyl-diaminopimelate desuccinylase-like protein